MLFWVPPPEPMIHDEFGHLLVGDTLASGRLANPPHPMARHLETLYVLQEPAYASIYPIGQGLALAAGKALVGTPWAGVLLGVGLMSGAITWMLLARLPAGWAAVGGLIAASSYGLHYDWINTYWGGALCAFAGALFFGALCRLRTAPSALMGWIAGAAWSLIWLIRPFESILLFLFGWACLAYLVKRDLRAWRRWAATAVLLLLGQATGGVVTALHNKQVTGTYTTLPYRLSQQFYGVPQTLLGQAPVPPPPARFAEARRMYEWQRNAKEVSSRKLLLRFRHIITVTLKFFAGPWFLAPLVMTLFLAGDRTVLVAIGLMSCAVLAALLYPFFFPHYIAAYACVAVFLVTRGLMALADLKYQGRPVGQFAAALLIASGIAAGVPVTRQESVVLLADKLPGEGLRAGVEKNLYRKGGQHLVLVRYEPGHSFHDEWVYNAADVDRAAIVWCRSIDPAADAEAVRYFSGRQVWLASVGKDSAKLSPYGSDHAAQAELAKPPR